jgi:hypothetical protein
MTRMSAIFDAYDLPVESLVAYYRRLNQPIRYPDGMLTSLGIVYWGRDDHLTQIEAAIPRLVENGLARFSDVVQAVRTPTQASKLVERAGISPAVLRILKHDLELWLPQAVRLDQFEWFHENPPVGIAFAKLGLADQLALVSAGKTPALRQALAGQTNFDPLLVDQAVRLCDYYRTGKNLEHIRAKIYSAMGMDTWQKWAEATAEDIIALFTQYLQENNLEGERLVPWPKEVRNGIEWARLHLEIFAVQW